MKTKLPQYWGIQCMHNAPVSTMTFQADFKVKQARSSCHSHVGQLKAAGHKAQQSGCSNTSRHVLQTCQIWPSLVISTSTSGADDVLSSRHSTHPSRHSQPLLPHMACMHWLPQGPAAQSICPCKPCHAPPLHRQLDCAEVAMAGGWSPHSAHTHTHTQPNTHTPSPASQPASPHTFEPFQAWQGMHVRHTRPSQVSPSTASSSLPRMHIPYPRKLPRQPQPPPAKTPPTTTLRPTRQRPRQVASRNKAIKQ